MQLLPYYRHLRCFCYYIIIILYSLSIINYCNGGTARGSSLWSHRLVKDCDVIRLLFVASRSSQDYAAERIGCELFED